MTQERILITVRTYPTFSKSYIETVCTGGINDRGEWRRLYPVALRYQDESKKYGTYDVVEVALRDGTDGRPETRKPEMSTLSITGHARPWRDRCQWINPTICPSLAAMTSANRSIGPIAVRRVLELIAEPTASDWSAEQRAQLQQSLLFEKRLDLEKVPFDFRLRWEDQDGQEHGSLVLAWEMYQTWRRFRRHYPDAVEKLREKFMADVFSDKRELSLHMGNHHRFRDKWMVVGWFNPPKEEAASGSLFGS